MIDRTEEDTLYKRIDKVEKLLKQDLSQDARRIWTNKLRDLQELRWHKANERIEALARFGGAFIEF
jgi:hypothetical protein|tara:strand:- start:317 stop:514 length:198 start_codon:yes stop_codon:yes gene_type:complete